MLYIEDEKLLGWLQSAYLGLQLINGYKVQELAFTKNGGCERSVGMGGTKPNPIICLNQPTVE